MVKMEDHDAENNQPQQMKEPPTEVDLQQVWEATKLDIVKNKQAQEMKKPPTEVDLQQVREATQFDTAKNPADDCNPSKDLRLSLRSETQADLKNHDQNPQISQEVTGKKCEENDHSCTKKQPSQETTETQKTEVTLTTTSQKTQMKAVEPKKKGTQKKPRKVPPKQTQTRFPKQKRLFDMFRGYFSFVLTAKSIRCYIFFLLFGLLIQAAVSKTIMVDFEQQTLPEECRNEFNRFEECPDFDPEYKKMNEKCCQDSEGAVLHCLSYSDPDTGRHILSASCLSDTLVPAGHFMNIIDRNGFPQKVVLPCLPGEFEPKDRNSSKIRYPDCKNKIPCNATEGQQTFCDGGRVKEDLCMCSPGYEPPNWNMSTSECKGGFGTNAMCYCVKAPCSAGTTRNINYTSLIQCPDHQNISMKLNYACTIKTDMTTPPSNVTPNQNKTHNPSLYSNSAHGQVTPGKKSVDLSWLLVLIPLISGQRM